MSKIVIGVFLAVLSFFVLFGCTQPSSNPDLNSDVNYIGGNASGTVPEGSGDDVDAADNPVLGNQGSGSVEENPQTAGPDCSKFISQEDVVGSLKLSAGTEITYSTSRDGCSAIWLDPVPIEGTGMKASGNVNVAKFKDAATALNTVNVIWGCNGKDSLSVGDASCKNLGYNFAQGSYAAKLVSVSTTAGHEELIALATIVAGKIAGTN